jgi:hypothetical protein
LDRRAVSNDDIYRPSWRYRAGSTRSAASSTHAASHTYAHMLRRGLLIAARLLTLSLTRPIECAPGGPLHFFTRRRSLHPLFRTATTNALRLPHSYLHCAGKKLVEFMLDPATKKKHGLETVTTEEQVGVGVEARERRAARRRHSAVFFESLFAAGGGGAVALSAYTPILATFAIPRRAAHRRR